MVLIPILLVEIVDDDVDVGYVGGNSLAIICEVVPALNVIPSREIQLALPVMVITWPFVRISILQDALPFVMLTCNS